jgi:hypothetical protein
MPTLDVGGTGENTIASARALLPYDTDLANQANPDPSTSQPLQVTGKPHQRLWALSPVNGVGIRIDMAFEQEGGAPVWRPLTPTTILVANVPAILEVDFPATLTRIWVVAPANTAVNNFAAALSAYAG